MIQQPPNIEGALALAEWFGDWPTFHDAEVLELRLNREGESQLTLSVFRLGREVDEGGLYRHEKLCRVTFVFQGVSNLSLEGFNAQNVIAGLRVIQLIDGIQIELLPIYGISGMIVASTVRVEFSPVSS